MSATARRQGRPRPTAAMTRAAFARPVTSVMVWFAPRRLPGRPSSPKGRSAIAARRPAAALDPGASATLTVQRTGQARGPARHDAPREPHHHSERSDTTSSTCVSPSHLRDHFVDKHAANPPPRTTTTGGHPKMTHGSSRRAYFLLSLDCPVLVPLLGGITILE